MVNFTSYWAKSQSEKYIKFKHLCLKSEINSLFLKICFIFNYKNENLKIFDCASCTN